MPQVASEMLGQPVQSAFDKNAHIVMNQYQQLIYHPEHIQNHLLTQANDIISTLKRINRMLMPAQQRLILCEPLIRKYIHDLNQPSSQYLLHGDELLMLELHQEVAYSCKTLLSELADVDTAPFSRLLYWSIYAVANQLIWQFHNQQSVFSPLWQELHYLFDLANQMQLGDDIQPDDNKTIKHRYKQALLFSIANPKGFSGECINELFEFIETIADSAVLTPVEFSTMASQHFIVNLDSNQATFAQKHVQKAWDQKRLWRFDLQLILGQAKQQLFTLKPSSKEHNDHKKALFDAVSLTIKNWSQNCHRQDDRSECQLESFINVGLINIYRHLKHKNQTEPHIDCLVLNKSSQGACIELTCDKLSEGDLIAVFDPSEKSDSLGVVRWKHKHSEAVQYGIQLLKGSVQPVTLGDQKQPLSLLLSNEKQDFLITNNNAIAPSQKLLLRLPSAGFNLPATTAQIIQDNQQFLQIQLKRE